MNDIKVTLVGNACADPEPRTGRNGTQFAVFRVAVNEGWMGESGWVEGPTTFMQVSAFEPLARGVLRSVRKGDPVIVHGRLRVNTWTNDKDEVRSAPEVRAHHVGHDLSKGIAAFNRHAARSTRVEGDGSESAGSADRFAPHDLQDPWPTEPPGVDDIPVDAATGEVDPSYAGLDEHELETVEVTAAEENDLAGV